jgi:alpha-L-fucosidase
MKNNRSIILTALWLFATCVIAVADSPETPAQRDARMKWWTDARFGMFIHWDMSSVAGTEISWSRKGSKPLDIFREPAGYVEDPVYDNLYKQFDPVKFNAKQWVMLAKDAGMKYIVFTAKHHGGFCMWDTKLTDYSIMHTPFRRDVVKELADACHQAGVHFGIYYSPRDWHHPDYGIGDNSKYHKYMMGQLTELLTNYGKVDVIWFDSFGHGDSFKYWHADEVLALVRKLQPQAVINNRCSFFGEANRPGLEADFDTPENEIGAYQIHRPWESCICVMDDGNWSYRPDSKLKSFSECIKRLVGCATGDGNLLLDVGPSPLGEIPADQTGRMREIGAWLQKYGQSIYDTHGGPFRNGRWGGATFAGNDVYLHIFPSAFTTFQLPVLNSKLVAAKNLTGGTVKTVEKDGRISVTIPVDSRTEPDTVIKLTFDRPVTRVEGGITETGSIITGLDDLAGTDATYTASSLEPKWSGEKDTLLKGTCRGEFAFHTKEDEKNPWIIIDLKQDRQIEAVLIENRPILQDRAKSLTMWTSSDSTNWTEVWRAPEVAKDWTVVPVRLVAGARTKGVTARYIKLGLQVEKPTPLHLRSVKVYGR